MRRRLMVFVFALVGAGVCVGLGMFIERRLHSAQAASITGASARAADSNASSRNTNPTQDKNQLVGGSSAVEALLAGFDPTKSIDSQLVLLQRIREASPAELAAMVKAMAGLRRGDQAWTFAKNALTQRFVELAPDEAIAWAKVARKHGEELHQVSTIFATLAKIDPGRAMTEAQRIEDASFRKNAINSVIFSISQVHPDEAFRLTQTLPDGYPSQVLLFGNWAERDPRGAAAAFLTFKDRAQREPACRALMDRWTSQDPAAALEWARGLTEPVMRQAALDEYFGILGKRDPEATIAQISELPRSQQSRFLSKLAGNWMKTDPAAATAWILGRPDPIEKQQMILAAGGPGGFGYTDMTGEEVSKFVAELNPGQARQDGLKEAFRMTWKDPGALVAFAKSLPAAEEMAFREVIVQRLAYKNPDKALNYLQDHSGEVASPQVWSSIAGGIAKTSSPEKALEWANALPDEALRRKVLPGLLWQIALQTPGEAAKHVVSLTDEATRLESISRVAGTWSETAMDNALDWAKGLVGQERETAMTSVLSEGASRQPITAAEQLHALVSEVPVDGTLSKALVGAVGPVAKAYFAENEQAAARWATNLPHEDACAAASKSVAEQWARVDPAGASEWIGTLPNGQMRDAAVGPLVGAIARSDPSTAFMWASTVVDSDERSGLVETALASWSRIDPAAARKAIDSTDWPAEEKSRWLDEVR